MDAGELLFSYQARCKPTACVAGEGATVRQQRRKHRDVEDCFGAYFDRSVLVGDCDRIDGRNGSHYQPWTSQEGCAAHPGFDRDVSGAGARLGRDLREKRRAPCQVLKPHLLRGPVNQADDDSDDEPFHEIRYGLLDGELQSDIQVHIVVHDEGADGK